MEETKDALELRLLRRIESLLIENVDLKRKLENRPIGNYCPGCGCGPSKLHKEDCPVWAERMRSEVS